MIDCLNSNDPETNRRRVCLFDLIWDQLTEWAESAECSSHVCTDCWYLQTTSSHFPSRLQVCEDSWRLLVVGRWSHTLRICTTTTTTTQWDPTRNIQLETVAHRRLIVSVRTALKPLSSSPSFEESHLASSLGGSATNGKDASEGKRERNLIKCSQKYRWQQLPHT